MPLPLERRAKFITLLTILAIVASIVWLPITTVTVPAWNVQIVDTAGRALNGACVYQTWQQYSFEARSHNAEVKADAEGRAKFPERTATATLFQRMVRPISQLTNIHSSFGASSWIIAGAPNLQGMATYEAGDTPPKTIVATLDSNKFEWEPGSIAKRCSPI